LSLGVVERLGAVGAVNPADARTDTPPIPSRPSKTEQHREVADARSDAEDEPLGR